MTISPLTKALGYVKFPSGRKPRVMVMKSSYFIVADVIDAARHLGWAVQESPTALSQTGDSAFVKQLLMALVQFKPDFLLTINHIGFDEEGVLGGLLDGYGIPFASWFVDHPMMILAGSEKNARKSCQVFSFERTSLPWLESAGFEGPAYLPTASNAAVFRPDRVDPAKCKTLGRPLSLVAGSWWQKARLSYAPEIHREAAALRAAHTVDRHYVLSALERDLRVGDRDALRRHIMVAQAALAETSMEARTSFAEALAEQGLVVFGDEHWKQLVSGLQIEPPVDSRCDLPSLFAGSAVNTNVTAEQMPTAVNQRVWDVPGVGGFLLADAQADLLEYFEDGIDVATFESLDEAKDKARHYLAHPAERQRIAARGLAKVEAQHRTHHRLETIEAVMRRRFG